MGDVFGEFALVKQPGRLLLDELGMARGKFGCRRQRAV